MARTPAPPSGFVAFLLDVLSPLGAVSARRMFGGVGLFRGEMMFGLVTRDETLCLKVGDGNRPAFEAAGQAPFSYATKHGTNTIASYWSCPPDLLDDTDALRDWARGAVTEALTKRAKPARQKKPAAT